MPDPTPIPLTVLGGWLGAGKTTLLNRILTETDERIAVIVNDVGEINVDAALIETANDVDGIVELTNGCVCCSVADDLEMTLIEMTRREPAPGRIILEASGVADPAQIAQHARHPRVRLDAIVTLAAAGDFTDRSSRPPYGTLMRTQVEHADLVIATKLDVLESNERDDAIDELRLFTDAPVVANTDDETWRRAITIAGHQPGGATAGPGHAAHVATATWRRSGLTDLDALHSALASSELLRAKGSVSTPDGPMIVHLAGGRVTTEPTETALGAVVLIGPDSATIAAVMTALDEHAATAS